MRTRQIYKLVSKLRHQYNDSPSGRRQLFWSVLMADIVTLMMSFKLLTYAVNSDGFSADAYWNPIASCSQAVSQIAALGLLCFAAIRCRHLPFLVQIITWLLIFISREVCGGQANDKYNNFDLDATVDDDKDAKVRQARVKSTSAIVDPLFPADRSRRVRQRWRRPLAALCRFCGHPIVFILLFAWHIRSIHLNVEDLMDTRYKVSRRAYVTMHTLALSLVVVVSCVFIMALRTLDRATTVGLISRRTMVVLMACATVLLFIVPPFTPAKEAIRYFRFDTRAHLIMSPLRGQKDLCSVVGKHLRHDLAKEAIFPLTSETWVKVMSKQKRRCEDSHRKHRLSFLDNQTETLVINTRCWDMVVRPRVLIEAGAEMRMLVKDGYVGEPYHEYIESRFGTEEQARAARVKVFRGGELNTIEYVELDESWLAPVKRAPEREGSLEAEIRSHWHSQEDVLEIPLGNWSHYMVRCPKHRQNPNKADFYDESHIYPVSLAARGLSRIEKGGTTRAPRTVSRNAGVEGAVPVIGVDEPPGNVFFVLFDAVSRQMFAEKMPIFNRWIRDFRDRQAARGGDGFIVDEPLHYSVVGVNSPPNVGAMFTGASAHLVMKEFGFDRTKKNPDLFNDNIFSDYKLHYSETVETTMTNTGCMDTHGIDTFSPLIPGSGHAWTRAGIDRYLYHPFCLNEYGDHYFDPARHCLNGFEPHQYSMNYTLHLFEQRQRRARANMTGPSSFFDILYIPYAHEPSLTVFPLVDSDFVAFMERLEKEFHFFDNPRNAFVIASDHGLHYGDYVYTSEAAIFERVSPLLMFAVHPEMMRRVDRMKHREEGTSATNFRARMQGFSSVLDFHKTLRDMLGIPEQRYSLYENAVVKPTSYFDHRSVLPTTCSDFTNNPPEAAWCTLDFCES